MVELKTKYVYNGIEYDTYSEADEAEKADKNAKVADFDPTNDIKGYIGRFNVLMFGTKKERAAFPDKVLGWSAKMPCMLAINDDGGDDKHYLITSPTELAMISFQILKQRLVEGFFYESNFEKTAQAIVDTDAKDAAYAFLETRNGDYEYEEVELQEFSKIKLDQ